MVNLDNGGERISEIEDSKLKHREKKKLKTETSPGGMA